MSMREGISREDFYRELEKYPIVRSKESVLDFASAKESGDSTWHGKHGTAQSSGPSAASTVSFAPGEELGTVDGDFFEALRARLITRLGSANGNRAFESVKSAYEKKLASLSLDDIAELSERFPRIL